MSTDNQAQRLGLFLWGWVSDDGLRRGTRMTRRGAKAAKAQEDWLAGHADDCLWAEGRAGGLS